ncbi:MFS general substrate transporter [Terfezia boudieri ATCC MYA-4762]|uniref:MFS general substrate transporter n=1 Tax=Terfezia boudieri ATCC MYA-4762 TaxID=1051890 RepID=A0A3N4LQC8_9PEZI|nr:MFS general substrate transporter [Terfezia boudieri ATCC MYA-4762]
MPPNEISPLLAGAQPNIRYDDHITDQAPQVNGNGATQDALSRNSSGGALEQDPDVPAISGVNIAAVVPAMAIGIFLASMDNTVVVASYGRIGTEMNELNRTSWLSTAYLLTTTSFQPLYGKLSDIYGRKACLLFAYSVFGLGCLFCGISRNLNDLIAARAFAGIGGGGMTTVASILMSDIVSIRKRGTWQGILNIIFALGAAVGGPLGGWLSDTIGWRWAFIGQAPLTLIAFLTVTFALHLPQDPVASVKTKLLRVDFPGAFTLVLAIFSFLLSLDLSINSIGFSMSSLITLSIFLGSVLLFVSFYHIENSYSAEPFCPPELVKRREILSPCIANFFCFGSAMVVLFHIPLFSQAVLGSSAAAAGQRLLPMIAGSMLGSLGGGIYIQKTGKYYWLTFCAYLGLFLGAGVIYICVLLTGTGPSQLMINMCMLVGMVIFNVGLGIGLTSTLIALISNVTSAEQAVVTAISYLFRSLGSVLSLSIAAGLVQTVLRSCLLEKLGGDDVLDIVRRVRRDLDYIGELKPDQAVVVRMCYQDGITDAMLFVVVLGFLCWVSSWGIREVKVKK